MLLFIYFLLPLILVLLLLIFFIYLFIHNAFITNIYITNYSMFYSNCCGRELYSATYLGNKLDLDLLIATPSSNITTIITVTTIADLTTIYASDFCIVSTTLPMTIANIIIFYILLLEVFITTAAITINPTRTINFFIIINKLRL